MVNYIDFPLFCKSFKKKDYTISVKEVYREGGIKKEKILIDSAPIKEEGEQKKKKEETVVEIPVKYIVV